MYTLILFLEVLCHYLDLIPSNNLNSGPRNELISTLQMTAVAILGLP